MKRENMVPFDHIVENKKKYYGHESMNHGMPSKLRKKEGHDLKNNKGGMKTTRYEEIKENDIKRNRKNSSCKKKVRFDSSIEYKRYVTNDDVCFFANLHKEELLVDTEKLNQEEVIGDIDFSSLPDLGQNPLPEEERKIIIKDHITKELEGSPYSNEIKKEVVELCLKHSKVFFVKDDIIKPIEGYECVLETEPHSPIYTNQYKLSLESMKFLEAEIIQLLKNKFIEVSSQSYNSPIFVVWPQKKTSSHRTRCVINYRKVNEVIRVSRFKLPHLSGLLSSLQDSNVLSIFDMKFAYHLLKLSRDSIDLTGFSVNNVSFRFLVAPFGVNCLPNLFSEFMTQIFVDFLYPELSKDKDLEKCKGCSLRIYLDDLLLCGNTDIRTYIIYLGKILERIEKVGLRIGLSKVKMMKTQINYLGHSITQKYIMPCESKVIAIKGLSRPNNKKQLMKFLGILGYYRSYMYKMAHFASPLYDLLKKEAKFTWTDEHTHSFEMLKQLISESTKFRYPDLNLPFYIFVDSSKMASASFLAQKRDGEDNLEIIAFHSKMFTKAQQCLSATEIELLGLLHAVTHYHGIIERSEILIYTDHKALIGILKNIERPSTKLIQKIKMHLVIYNLKIFWVPGFKMSIADYLSRNSPCYKQINIDHEKFNERKRATVCTIINANDTVSGSHEKQYELPIILDHPSRDFVLKREMQTSSEIIANQVTIEDIKKSQNESEICNKIRDYINLHENKSNMNISFLNNFIEIDGILFYGKNLGSDKEQLRIYVPSKEIQDKLLYNAHTSLISSNHLGSRRVLMKLQEICYFPNLYGRILEYIKNCVTCIVYKQSRCPRDNQGTLPVATRPGEICYIDILGPFYPSRSYKYILGILDGFSCRISLYPLRNVSTYDTCQILFNKYVFEYGIPMCYVSDNAKCFQSEMLYSFCNILNIQFSHICARNPNSNKIERYFGPIKNSIRTLVEGQEGVWADCLSLVAHIHNSNYLTTMNTSPNTLYFGRAVRSNVIFDYDWVTDIRTEQNSDVTTYINRVSKMYSDALNHSELYKERIKRKMKICKALPKPNIGQQFFIKRDRQVGDTTFRKNFDGPFVINKVISPRVIEYKSKAGNLLTVALNRIRLILQEPIFIKNQSDNSLESKEETDLSFREGKVENQYNLRSRKKQDDL